MAAMYRLKGIGWLGSCAFAAIGFYLVSSQVAAERKKLEQIDRQIVSAERDIRALETEFDVRANLAQLERWNGDTLALTVPVAAQFVSDEGALAALSPRPTAIMPGQPELRTAALIVPAAPVAPVLTPASVAAAPAVHSAPAATPPAASTAVSTVAIAAAAPLPRMVKVAAVRMAMKVTAQPASATGNERPRAIRAVAMLDKSLLSDTTLGDLLSGARSERGRLR
ncbi:hypothetical protein ASG29_05155 [Sphingomonas sp. Leaf412]|uniref:hypothetical protein n=1 Tax=Sphingomonas sp. Leaf412 TaxID=1736370 RepID=UPI0006F2EB9A|nr:hypothetical protein [Sphingomonas sp. Leaf412]KQT33437.1 hypothetical protein ASG29_05155 [Sphingomonas sp. Leaf412]